MLVEVEDAVDPPKTNVDGLAPASLPTTFPPHLPSPPHQRLLPLLADSMASLDNANPTIHSSAASSSTGIFGAAARRAGGAGGAGMTIRDLWAEEGADDFFEDDLGQAGEREDEDTGDDIDAEEIFGAWATPALRRLPA